MTTINWFFLRTAQVVRCEDFDPERRENQESADPLYPVTLKARSLRIRSGRQIRLRCFLPRHQYIDSATPPKSMCKSQLLSRPAARFFLQTGAIQSNPVDQT
jgi:hypothetical protein